MDSTEAKRNADPPNGVLQEEQQQFDRSCAEAGVQLEAERIEEPDFFEDCMEEFKAHFEECMDRLGAKFRGSVDEASDEFEDCAEDLTFVTHSAGSVDELVLQIDECMMELGVQLEGSVEGSGSQFQGLTEQVQASKEDILSQSQCVEPWGPWPEECVESLGSQLQAYVEELQVYCERGVRELGTRFADSIEEVARLEQRRDELVEELLQLEEPMAQAVKTLREEVEELRRLLARAELDRWSLQEERRLLKRQLFSVARDCTQSRHTLATQQHEVQQLTIAQGELEAQAQLLTEERSQMREAHQNQLNTLRSHLDSLSQMRTQVDSSQCRQPVWDLSSYLQDGMKALEEQYEPRLQALLKRKQATADALQVTRAETQELRGRLGPLREEAQRLGLQKTCLEEKITLKQQEREARVAQYRDTVDSLEESRRELKTELQIQRKKNKEIQTLKNNLMKELDLCRGTTEVDGKLNPQSQET